jgi:ABC-type Zn uptake system ZnuABC Zn-binding protein ZnuA
MIRYSVVALACAVGAAVVPGMETARGLTPDWSAPALKVVTSTTDLHDIAHAVGGTRITAIHISEGYQDPHFVEAKPSFILQLKNADVFAFVGLDLEIGWMSLLVDGSRNPKVRPGGAGHLDVSRVIPVIDVASGNVDRSQGDVHPRGNPHYWLDPANGKRIAKLFQQKFSELDPAGAAYAAANEKTFETRRRSRRSSTLRRRRGPRWLLRSRGSRSSPGIRAGVTSRSTPARTSLDSWSPNPAFRRRPLTSRGSSQR